MFNVDKGHYHYYAAFTPFELAFPSFQSPFVTPLGVSFAPLLEAIGSSPQPRAAEFMQLARQLLGQAPDASAHTHFYDSDYTAHHRPAYAVFVHSLSVHTEATECVNTENKRGRMLADGATTIYSRGQQYASVFPVLNWTLLPGTTEVQNAAQDNEPPGLECSHIRDGDIRRSFVAGLADGDVGVSVMDFARAHVPSAATAGAVPARAPHLSGTPSPPVDPCVQAGKAWFFTPNLTLALGTDIRRGPACHAMALTTSLQQSNLFGRVYVGGDGPAAPRSLANNTNRTLALAAPGGSSQPHMHWVWHDGLVYVVLVGAGDGVGIVRGEDVLHRACWNGTTLTVANQVRQGNEQQIIESGTNSTIQRQVFSVFLNHPASTSFRTDPANSSYSYAYAIVPSPTVAGTPALLRRMFGPSGDVTVLSNVKPVQAVCTRSPQLLQIIAWPTPSVEVSAGQRGGGGAAAGIDGSNAGCWNILLVAFSDPAATANGVLLQIRANKGALAVSAVAPPLLGTTMQQRNMAVTIHIADLVLDGDACVHDASGGGSKITVGLSSTGATSVVNCLVAKKAMPPRHRRGRV